MYNSIKQFSAVYLIIFTLLFSVIAQAQLTVDVSPTIEALAESLVGSGVTVDNVMIDCPGMAFGAFDGSMSSLGISAGVMLTSGSVFNGVGPNNMGGAGTDNFAPGDPVLDAISSASTFDACVFEFDVTPLSDTLAFNYVFGSEEYLEFVFAGFNDVFAFEISGPGISGTENIALVPGTTTPVSIDNVNDAVNPSFYVNNGDGFTPPFSSDPFYIQYDGFTVPLQARRAVTPCATYHLRLAIADAGDGIYDSGVFIEAGSLTSFGVELSSSTSVGFGFSNAVEGCVDGIITFTRDLITSDTLFVPFELSGTATNGVDYTVIDSFATILPDSASFDLIIEPTVDGLPEGTETVTIFLLSECSSMPLDSVTLGIQDEIVLELATAEDTTICDGESIPLSASGGLLYSWTPPGSLDDPFSSNPIATPLSSTTYTVTTTVGTCFDTAELTINVAPPVPADAGEDESICIGSSVPLDASGGDLYSWSPSGGLDNPDVADPIATPTVSTMYTVTVTDEFGCIGMNDIVIMVLPLPEAFARPDTTICEGSSIQLISGGGTSYNWSPATNLDDPNSQFPIATLDEASTYTVTVTDGNGCANTAEITINTSGFPGVDAGMDTLVFAGESIVLDGSGSGSFIWSPSESLSDPFIGNPISSPEMTTLYVLSATNEFGCTSFDTVLITVIFDPIVEFPNIFSPNGDGTNDEFGAIVRGPVDINIYAIFNRWGQQVFYSTDPNQSWNGDFLGEPQDVGTYIYFLSGKDPNGITIERNGSFTLVR